MVLESTGFWEAVGVPTTPSPAARPNSKARGCSWGKESGRLGFLRPSAVGERALRRGSGGGRLGAPQTCLCGRVSGASQLGRWASLLYKPPSRAWDPVGAAPVFG